MRPPNAALLLLASSLLASLYGCSHDWDGLDPRLTGAGGDASTAAGLGGASTTVSSAGGATGATTSTTGATTSTTGATTSTTTTGATTTASTSTGGAMTCDAQFGGTAGYVFCEAGPGSPPSYCDFSANTSMKTCTELCAMSGGSCVAAFDDMPACVLGPNPDVPCGNTGFASTVCRCSL